MFQRRNGPRHRSLLARCLLAAFTAAFLFGCSCSWGSSSSPPGEGAANGEPAKLLSNVLENIETRMHGHFKSLEQDISDTTAVAAAILHEAARPLDRTLLSIKFWRDTSARATGDSVEELALWFLGHVVLFAVFFYFSTHVEKRDANNNYFFFINYLTAFLFITTLFHIPKITSFDVFPGFGMRDILFFALAITPFSALTIMGGDLLFGVANRIMAVRQRTERFADRKFVKPLLHKLERRESLEVEEDLRRGYDYAGPLTILVWWVRAAVEWVSERWGGRRVKTAEEAVHGRRLRLDSPLASPAGARSSSDSSPRRASSETRTSEAGSSISDGGAASENSGRGAKEGTEEGGKDLPSSTESTGTVTTSPTGSSSSTDDEEGGAGDGVSSSPRRRPHVAALPAPPPLGLHRTKREFVSNSTLLTSLVTLQYW